MSIPNPPFGLLGNAPMQTQLVDNQRSVTPPWGGWLNFLRQWLFLNIPTILTNASGVSTSINPIANGAFGDNIHDDTVIVQQTLNQFGQLYLPPGKVFLVTSTIVVPTGIPGNSPVFIYGGGIIAGSANPVISAPTNTAQNIQLMGVSITSTVAGATLLSVANQVGGFNFINGCFFGSPGGGASTAIVLNANTGTSWAITGCVFQSNISTAVSLTNQTGVEITGCILRNATGASVSTSGTCTYNLIATNGGGTSGPHFGAPVLNQFAEFTGTTQTITAGPSFVNVTGCSWTASATGTWLIQCNALVQQASAVANSTTIRFSKNGTGDTHTTVGGSGPLGEFPLFYSVQLALASGDVIQLQCQATTANATLIGTGNNGTTNISGAFLTT